MGRDAPRQGGMPTKAAEQRVSQPPKRKQRGPGRPFKPGQSGNPKGRPAIGKSLAEAVRRVGEEACEIKSGPDRGISRLERAIRQLYREAGKGNAKAAAVILDRGWGKPPQPIAGDPENGPLLIRIVRE